MEIWVVIDYSFAQQLPIVCPLWIPQFNIGIKVTVLIQTGKRGDTAIPEGDVRRIPPAPSRILNTNPLFVERVENVTLLRAERRIFGSNLAPGYKQTAIA
jgi:hypothetical protein